MPGLGTLNQYYPLTSMQSSLAGNLAETLNNEHNALFDSYFQLSQFCISVTKRAYPNDKRIYQLIALFQGDAALPAGKISRRQVH
jgi:hypothetical protein